MSTEIAEVIFDKVQALPPEQQREVLSFVERLQLSSGLTGANAVTEPKTKTIWEEIDEIVSEVPPEAWDEVPPDGSLNHDHYLYGSPKKG